MSLYSIGKLSKKTNIPIRTLRYYDEIDLLKPAVVAESGYRYYSDREVQLLRHILALKQLGMSLDAIRTLLSERGHDEEHRWNDYFDYELARVKEQRAHLDNLERLLLASRHAYEMKGSIDPEDVFLFIKAIQSRREKREAFLARHFSDREARIIEQLPDLSSDDPRSLAWARLMREVRENMHEPPASAVSQDLAARLIETVLTWFEGDQELLDKYWSLIRPAEGEAARVFGLETEVMDYIDRIVDIFLENQREDAENDAKVEKENQ